MLRERKSSPERASTGNEIDGAHEKLCLGRECLVQAAFRSGWFLRSTGTRHPPSRRGATERMSNAKAPIILNRQKEDGWGTRVIERLAKYLRSEFSGMQGLSPRSLGYMKAFAEAWPDEPVLQQAAAKLPWGHNVRLLELLGHLTSPATGNGFYPPPQILDRWVRWGSRGRDLGSVLHAQAWKLAQSSGDGD